MTESTLHRVQDVTLPADNVVSDEALAQPGGNVDNPIESPSQENVRRSLTLDATLLVVISVMALSIGTYWTMRYGGYFGEGDTRRISAFASAIYEEGLIVTEEIVGYQSGFGFPALLAMVSHVTGIEINQLQLISSLWLVGFSVVAYICYRELIGNQVTAAVAVVILLLLPDFTFYVLRGSHEKITWTYTLMLIYLLVRSYRTNNLLTFAATILLFYLIFFSLASTHVFFSSTLISAIITSFGIGYGFTWLHRIRKKQRENETEETHNHILLNRSQINRLAIISMSGFILVYIVLNYVYTPAQTYYNNIEFVVDRTQQLFLSPGASEARQLAEDSPIGFQPQLWRSTGLYLLITAPQWLFVIASGVSWFVIGWRILRRPQFRFTPRTLLWLWFSAMAIQLALSVLMSLNQLLFFNNLLLRLFTPFALSIAPMSALLLMMVFRYIRQLPRVFYRLSVAGMALLFGFSALAMLLKVSNEPLLSNYWMYSLPQERSGIHWMENHASLQYIHLDLWTLRLDNYLSTQPYNAQLNNWYQTGSLESIDYFNYLITSDLTDAQAVQAQVLMPSHAAHNRIYDNGATEIYYRRPVTPYQN